MLVSGVVDADISPKPTLNRWWASRTRVPPPEKGIVGFQDVRFFTPTNARHATSRYWYPGMHRGHRGHRWQRGVRVVRSKKKKEDSRTFDREHCTATPACPDDDDRDDMYVLICECS